MSDNDKNPEVDTGSGDGNGDVECFKFEDPNLEKCFVSVISDTCVRKKHVSFFHVLACGRDVKSLKGIENMAELEDLSLRGSSIEDLTPLSKLENLTEVELDGNNVKSIAPLQNLKRLRDLSVSYNKELSFADIEGGFESLVWLTHDHSGTVSIKGLEKLRNNKKLKNISLINNKIEDASPLKDFVYLENLYIQKNRIRSAEPFRNLVSLEYISVGENCILDLKPFEDLLNRAPNLDDVYGDVNHQQMGDWCY